MVKPDVSNLMTFVCTEYVNIPSQFFDNKLASLVRTGMIFGLIGGLYRVLSTETGRILDSRDVRTIDDTIEGEIGDDLVEVDHPEIYNLLEKRVDPPLEMDDDKLALSSQDELDEMTHYPYVRR